MKIYVIIPAYNEAENIALTLQSLLDQTLLPQKIIVVNDNSTDNTPQIVTSFTKDHPNISLVNSTAKNQENSPGSKVVEAFYKGYKTLDEDFDIICKFDADLIFPENYIQTITEVFKKEPKAGMVGGFCTIKKNGSWETENLTDKGHIRGALKAYRKQCFLEIGKLKPAMGWDTADELIARYHGWKVKTVEGLLVKHLKPTGASYSLSSGERQGEAFYRLRYGFPITLIASAKLSFLKKDPGLFLDYIRGYLKAKNQKRPFLVSEEEGRFIRNFRSKKIREKIFRR